MPLICGPEPSRRLTGGGCGVVKAALEGAEPRGAAAAGAVGGGHSGGRKVWGVTFRGLA